MYELRVFLNRTFYIYTQSVKNDREREKDFSRWIAAWENFFLLLMMYLRNQKIETEILTRFAVSHGIFFTLTNLEKFYRPPNSWAMLIGKNIPLKRKEWGPPTLEILREVKGIRKLWSICDLIILIVGN